MNFQFVVPVYVSVIQHGFYYQSLYFNFAILLAFISYFHSNQEQPRKAPNTVQKTEPRTLSWF